MTQDGTAGASMVTARHERWLTQGSVPAAEGSVSSAVLGILMASREGGIPRPRAVN